MDGVQFCWVRPVRGSLATLGNAPDVRDRMPGSVDRFARIRQGMQILKP
jgi:hypothetical protein